MMKRNKKRLELNPQRLRELSEPMLAAVAGGLTSRVSCFSQNPQECLPPPVIG